MPRPGPVVRPSPKPRLSEEQEQNTDRRGHGESTNGEGAQCYGGWNLEWGMAITWSVGVVFTPAGVGGVITWSVGVALVVQPASGYRLAAKQGVTVQVVAEFLQEAQDVGDAADRGQSQSALLLLKVGCMGSRGEGSRVKGKQKVVD